MRKSKAKEKEEEVDFRRSSLLRNFLLSFFFLFEFEYLERFLCPMLLMSIMVKSAPV